MRIRRLFVLTILFIAIMFVCVVDTAIATTIDPILWEEFALRSDFIGIVECTKAGGIVAEYRVLESLKGAGAGETIRLKMAFDTWSASFPIALRGEKYFVTAFRAAPSNIMSTTYIGFFPLWGRMVKHDYELPLHQGMVRLPAQEDWRFRMGAKDSKAKNFGEFLDDIRELLAKDRKESELLLLKAIFDKESLEGQSIESVTMELKSQGNYQAIQLINSVRAAETSANLIDILAETLGSEDFPYSDRMFSTIVSQGVITKDTLTHVEKILGENQSFDPGMKQRVITMLRMHIIPEEAAPLDSSATKPVLGKKQLDDYEAVLFKGTGEEMGEAFVGLTWYRPGVVADWLAVWAPSKDQPYENATGYGLATLFATQCTKDRKTHFLKIIKAKDPYIRVIAAIYMTIDGDGEGPEWLVKFQELGGAPGLLASINLARRGDKNALDRILDSIRNIKGNQVSFVEGMIYGSIFARTLVLLSNSASSGSVEMPAVLKTNVDASLSSLVAWWEQNKEKLTLYDPWLKELTEQTID
jgi:hypothetical protein